MNVETPALEQFTVQAVDEIRFSATNEELRYSVEIEPCSVTNRVLVGLVDQRHRTGMAIAIYPATGEVCDVLNDGGVIGYLTNTPLDPSRPIKCELTLFRFGKNFVCSAMIGGETFLYPAFCCETDAPMAAVVGKENRNGDNRFNWNCLQVESHQLTEVIAA